MMPARLATAPALQRLSTLQWALGLSVLLHAVVLTVRFVDPQGLKRVFENNTLDVVLVNAKSDEKPVKAQAIAQHNLAGGGEASDARIASTPLPPSAREAEGDAALDQSQREIQRMLQQREQLLAQVRQQLAALPRPDPARTQDDPQALLPEDAARLGAGVVELAGLADDDRAGADDQDRADVGTARHQLLPSVVAGRPVERPARRRRRSTKRSNR